MGNESDVGTNNATGAAATTEARPQPGIIAR